MLGESRDAAYGKTVWSWHPLLVSSRRRRVDPTGFRQSFNPPATEARRIRLQGERGISRQTIAQGMPECSSCTCMLVCVLFALFAHETAVAASTRHSLRPLISEGQGSCKPRAQCAARLRSHIHVIASEAKQSIVTSHTEGWIASLRSQ